MSLIFASHEQQSTHFIQFVLHNIQAVANKQPLKIIESDQQKVLELFPWIHPCHFDALGKKQMHSQQNFLSRGESLYVFLCCYFKHEVHDPKNRDCVYTKELPYTGLNVGYDYSFQEMLKKVGELYQNVSESVFKIADIGYGRGNLACMLPYASDGSKEMHIYVVDGVQDHQICLDHMHQHLEKHVGGVEKVFYKHMTKKIQDLPSTNSFGASNLGTFHCLICSNVFHSLSYFDKREALSYYLKLLQPGSVLMLTHLECNALSQTNYDQLEDGLYSYPVSADQNGDRLEIKNLPLFSFQMRTEEECQKILPMQPIYYDEQSKKWVPLSFEQIKAGITVLKAQQTFDYHCIVEKVSEKSLRALSESMGFKIISSCSYLYDDPRATNAEPLMAGVFYPPCAKGVFLILQKPV